MANYKILPTLESISKKSSALVLMNPTVLEDIRKEFGKM